MTGESVLVIDAGASRLRCHVFDGNGHIVSSSDAVWEYIEEPDAPQMAKAFDPQWLWQACCNAVNRCMADGSSEVGAAVSCVSVTSQRQSVVFLDAGGNEIYAGPNMDLRGVFEGAAIDDEYRDRVYKTTGHLPSFFFTPAKLLWFRQQQPADYARIATVLSLADWLAWRLTGVLANETTLAGEAGLLEIGSRRWCNEFLGTIGLPEQTNLLTKSGEIIGETSAYAAQQTVLRRGLPVTVAGPDTQCGLLGMGVVDTGQVGVVSGWSAPVQMVTAQPVFSDQMRTWVGCHLIKDRWVVESSAGATGNAYQWMADTLYGDSENPFSKMASDASRVCPGSNGALSMMGNSAMDMSSLRMTYGGIMFPVPMTSATGNINRGHLARAALESTAYAIRANVEQLEVTTGQRARSISLGGGMTRTEVFPKILTDVMGRDVLLAADPDVTAKGAYLSARKAMGDFSSLEEAAGEAAKDMQTLKPEPRHAAEYEDYYQAWSSLSASLKKVDI